jgi:hypothetical protein
MHADLQLKTKHPKLRTPFAAEDAEVLPQCQIPNSKCQIQGDTIHAIDSLVLLSPRRYNETVQVGPKRLVRRIGDAERPLARKPEVLGENVK